MEYWWKWSVPLPYLARRNLPSNFPLSISLPLLATRRATKDLEDSGATEGKENRSVNHHMGGFLLPNSSELFNEGMEDGGGGQKTLIQTGLWNLKTNVETRLVGELYERNMYVPQTPCSPGQAHDRQLSVGQGPLLSGDCRGWYQASEGMLDVSADADGQVTAGSLKGQCSPSQPLPSNSSTLCKTHLQNYMQPVERGGLKWAEMTFLLHWGIGSWKQKVG